MDEQGRSEPTPLLDGAGARNDGSCSDGGLIEAGCRQGQAGVMWAMVRRSWCETMTAVRPVVKEAADVSHTWQGEMRRNKQAGGSLPGPRGSMHELQTASA